MNMRDPLEDVITAAIADPGAFAGRKHGPSWGRGNDGYAPTEETVARWGSRAVLTVLDNERRLIPAGGRVVTLLPAGEQGRDSSVHIQVDGAQNIFRLLVNMLGWQCEFGQGASAALIDLRDLLTPARFDPMARSLLGADQYEQLRYYFQRNWFCAGCEKEIRVGTRYAPTRDGGAACASCCRGTEFASQLVKRVPDPEPVPA